MNKLFTQDRVAILNCLSEGMGINAAARITGKSKNTVLKLLADAGEACAAYQDRVMVNLLLQEHPSGRNLELCGCQAKELRADDAAHADYGDAYTLTAIDPDTKLMPCWLVGVRTGECANDFMADLARVWPDAFNLLPMASRSTLTL